MKLECIGDVKAQIKAGVEPWEKATIDLPLAQVSEAGRAILADGYQPKGLVHATPEAAMAAIDAEVVRRSSEDEDRKRQEDERRQSILSALRAPAEEYCTESAVEHGVTYQWQRLRLPFADTYSALLIAKSGDAEMRSAYDARKKMDADVDAANLAARVSARAEKAAEIEMAKAAEEQRLQEEKEKKEAALAAKKARRAEIGGVEMSITRGDRDWGTPWGAVVTAQRGRDSYDFDVATYDLSSETLTIKCAPGDVIAWGQKNFRKPNRSTHERRKVAADWGLVKI